MPTINVRWAIKTDELRRNLKEGVDQIEATTASVARLVKALSGDNLIAAAHKWTAAISEMGGVSKIASADAVRAFGTISKAIETLERQGKAVPQAMRDLSKELQASIPHASALNTWIGSLGTTILGTAAGFVSAQAILSAFRGVVSALGTELKTLTLHGAEVGDVTENFERLTAQAGHLGSTLLGTLRAGTHATITDFELMKTVNQDLAAGMNLTDQQFSTLAQGAFALAQATGGDVKTALDTMNDAMLTGRTRALALLTGKIDLEAAEKKYAASLGTTRDHLSEEGKLEAARMAILDGVSSATERLGEQTDGLDERVAQLSVTWKNFEDGLGRAIATSPVLAAALSTIKDDLVGAFGGDQAALVDALSKKVDDLFIALISVGRAGISVGGVVVTAFTAAAKVVGNLVQVLDGVRLAALLARQVTGGGFFDKTLDEQISRLELSMKQRGDTLQAIGKIQEGVSGTTTELTGKLDDLEQKMKAARDAHVAFVGPLQDVAAAEQGATKAGADHSALLKKSPAEISAATAALKKHQSALDVVASALGGYVAILASVTPKEKELVKAGLAAGVSQTDLAEAYKLSAVQVKAVATETEVLTKLQILNASSAIATMDALRDLGTVQDQEVFRLKTLFEWKKKLDELERSAAARIKFEDATPAQVLPDDVIQDLAEAEKRTKAFHDALSDLTGAFAQLAQISGDSFGGMLQNIGKVIGAINLAQTATEKYREAVAAAGKDTTASYAAAGSAVMSYYGILVQVVDWLNKVTGLQKNKDVALFAWEKPALIQAFVESLGDLNTLFERTGVTAGQVQIAIARALSAKTPAEFAAALRPVIEGLEAADRAAQQLEDDLRSGGFLSQDELDALAKRAQNVFDTIAEGFKKGQYTQEQLDKAFRNFMEAMAAAGDAAAKAWLEANKAAGDAATIAEKATTAQQKALDALLARRDELSKGIDAEAWEPDMGSIERAMREERDRIDAQIAAGQAAQTAATEAAAAASAEAVGGAATSMQNDMGVTAETIEELLRTGGQAAATATEVAMGEAGTNMSNDMGVTAETIEELLSNAGKNAAQSMVETFAGLKLPDVHARIVWDVPDLPPDRRGTGGGGGGEDAERTFGRVPAFQPPRIEPWSMGESLVSATRDSVPTWLAAGETVRTPRPEAALVGTGGSGPIVVENHNHNTLLLDGQVLVENYERRIEHDQRGAKTRLKKHLGLPR